MYRYQIALAKLEGPRQMMMTPAGLFRSVADELPLVEQNWEWVAPHLSRRISRISERRARDLVARNGGKACEMKAERN